MAIPHQAMLHFVAEHSRSSREGSVKLAIESRNTRSSSSNQGFLAPDADSAKLIFIGERLFQAKPFLHFSERDLMPSLQFRQPSDYRFA